MIDLYTAIFYLTDGIKVIPPNLKEFLKAYEITLFYDQDRKLWCGELPPFNLEVADDLACQISGFDGVSYAKLDPPIPLHLVGTQ